MNAETDLQPAECNRQWKSFSIHWPLCYFLLSQLVFFPTFVEKPFLSLSGHERIKTLLADELSACAPRCTAAINHRLPAPLPFVSVWKLNWDLDLFGFLISADNKPPCDHGHVGRICSSGVEIIGEREKGRFLRKAAVLKSLFLLHTLSVKELSRLVSLTCCIHSSPMWHTKKDMKAFNLFN